jgi:transposase-like protein
VYLYQAIDQYGQVIDMLMSEQGISRPPAGSSPAPWRTALARTGMSTDRAPAYPRVLDEMLPAACHVVEQYANNPIEADYGRFKARLRPICGLKRLRSAGVIGAGHGFVQNLRRGHYELGVDTEPRHRLSRAFAELALAI